MTTKVLISGNGMSIKERAKRIAQRANCKHRTEDGNCSKIGIPCIEIDNKDCPKSNNQIN